MGVTTTLVVSFGGAAASALLQAEVDTRPTIEGGLNAVTTFAAGDPVHYLVYQYGLKSLSQIASAGSLVKVSNGTRQITETVTFANTAEATVQYPVKSLDSVEWVGRSLGAVSSTGGNALRSAQAGVAVARITYTTQFEVWRLNSPAQINGKDAFDILIYLEGA